MIRDEALDLAVADLDALKQPLRDLHRAAGGIAKLPAGFLRERGGGKRRRRTLEARLGLDRRDRPGQVPLERGRQRPRGGFVEVTHAARLQLAGGRIEVLAGRHARLAKANQRRGKLLALARQLRFQVPVGAGPERTPGFLPFDDQPDGDALDAPGAESGLHLLPQHRRQRVAVEPIDDAPALLRPDQALVDVAGMREGVVDRLFRDLVELDPADGDLGLEDLAQVPGDRLAFAVGVGRQQHFGGVLERRLQILDILLLVVRDDVVRREVAFEVHAKPAPRACP